MAQNREDWSRLLGQAVNLAGGGGGGRRRSRVTAREEGGTPQVRRETLAALDLIKMVTCFVRGWLNSFPLHGTEKGETKKGKSGTVC